ncbi:MAG: acetyl-CoA carboxylase, carboxyltransferase subunit beta [Clostridium chrysemydis]|uniref:acetyl-CoA carboxylase, carboxyltransferase subunit beta n=1 Tax=Clostridium chrysemydis TaxID=2665504 RepID=UPI003F304435
MLKDLFSKKKKYATIKGNSESLENKPNIPSGMWTKCEDCHSIIYHEDLVSNNYVCKKCNYHFKLRAKERINLFFDKDKFTEYDRYLRTKNPLEFEGYEEKITKALKSTDSLEGVITGVSFINGIKVCTAVMDSYFMMGSMGTVVGEKITRIVELATKEELPLIIFTTSGGARMQEGILSLMQMAKVSAALARHSEKGLLNITILTHPTTGGVTASFAMEGDIILSEPRALVGFAGRRVIENTIKETLPDDFQTAEFLLQKGFVDKIVDRNNLRTYVYKILKIHGGCGYE